MADMDNARDELQDILSKEEYQIYYEDNRNFLEVWWDRFVNWLGEQLAKLFPAFKPSSGFADVVLFIVIAVVIVLIGLVVFLSIRKARRSRQFHDHQPLKSMHEKNWTYRDHLTEALKHESDDNYTGATRHMFLALLLYFHEKEWLEARNWKTNWEYFAELRQVNRQDADTFYHLALVFDEVVYGERILREDEFLKYHDEVMKWLDRDTSENPIEG